MSLPDVEFTVPPALDGERTDRVVALVSGLPRTDAADLVAEGRIKRNGDTVTTRSVRVQAGDLLSMDLPAPRTDDGPQPDPSVNVPVVFADNDVVVVDKPSGLVVHPGSGNPGGTLVNGLLAMFGDLADQPWPDPSRPGIVHRLDKGTSGLLVVARTVAAMTSLAGQLQAHTVERQYVKLVWGHVEAAAGVIDAPLGRSTRDPVRMAVRADGRPAVTNYEVRHRFDLPAPTTLLSCRLETGRTHQIRVHLSAIGHPVVGDDRYRRRGAAGRGGRDGGDASVVSIRRPFLHAEALSFDHPASAERQSFRAALPADLVAVLAELA